VERLDGGAVRSWAEAAAALLALAAQRIDAVNVFPVPDADTGTNVRLTIAGGARRAATAPAGAGPATVARAFAAGTLTAARGNSGVIVSQWVAGFASALADDEPVGADGVAAALGEAAAAAHGAVRLPQEGTVLTVARLVGERARHAARTGAALDALLGPVLDEARGELARISATHPVLREAHVVDAGACALLVVLEALERTLRGAAADRTSPTWLPERGLDAADLAAWRAAEPGGAYEVMALVQGSGLGSSLRERLGAVGDSVAVVGTGGLWQVHVHTDDPAAAVEAAGLGGRSQVVVRLVEGAAAQVAAGDDLGVVVATDAPGAARFFATGGAVVVVRCPEAPATADHLARAVADTGATRVVVLTAGAELAAAGRALTHDDELRGAALEVVAAGDTLAQAVAALAVLGGHGDATSRADGAWAALGRLRTVDVDVWADLATAAEALVEDAAGGAEAVTVQHGPGSAYDEAVALREHVTAVHPELDVVLVGPVEGGARWRIGVD